jgi:hypothetical protein
MVVLAEKLAKNASFLRVDFYLCGNVCYFGEITFFPASGFGKFVNTETDMELGHFLKVN